MSDLDEKFDEALNRKFEEARIKRVTQNANPQADEPLPIDREIPKDESYMYGLVEGLPIVGGLADEGAGAMDAANNAIEQSDIYRWLQEKLGQTPARRNTQTFGEKYRQTRDEVRENFAKAKEANPKTYYTGLGTGMVGGGIALGGAGLAGNASKLQGLTQAAGMGGLEGLARGTGDLTKGELSGYGQAALETALGAGTGALMYGAGDLAQRGISKAITKAKAYAPALKSKAEELAVVALRPFKKHTTKALDKGIVNELGRDLLESGVLKPEGGVVPGVSSDEIARRLELLGKERGGALNEVFDALQGKQVEAVLAARGAPGNALPSVAGEMPPPPVFADRGAIAKQIRQLAGNDVSRTIDPATASAVGDVADKIQNLATRQAGEKTVGNVPLGLKELREIRGALGRNINFEKASGQGGKAAAMRQAYGVLTGATKEHADELAKAYAPNLLGAVSKGDRAMELNLLANDIAQSRQAADWSNRLVSLSDYMTGLGGGVASAGDNLLEKGAKGAAVGALNKLLRERGSGMGARGFDALGDLLSKANIQTPNLTTGVAPYLAQQGAAQSTSRQFQDWLNAKKEEEAKQAFLEGTSPH